MLDRSTAASATFLQSIENPNEILLVGNTHLYFHPDADHIRLIQGGIVIYWLSDIQKKLTEKVCFLKYLLLFFRTFACLCIPVPSGTKKI